MTSTAKSISLSSVATALTSLVSAVESLEKLYTYASALMQATEDAYDSVIDAGQTKKEAVLAALKTFAEQMGLVWDEIVDEVSAWIDAVKAAYNTLTGSSTSSDTTTDTSAETSAETVAAVPAKA